MAIIEAAVTLVLAVQPVVADKAEDVALLEACVAAAGGAVPSAADTCLGQVAQHCLVSTPVEQGDLVRCAQAEQEAWTIILDATVTRLRERQPPQVVAAIETGQEAWRPWLDARCAIYGAVSGEGEFDPLLLRCLADTTAQRVVDLWAIERGLAGD
ncbi:MAG: lysozyme inhibitor LprI family protein [Pseudomonadota bacterium]